MPLALRCTIIAMIDRRHPGTFSFSLTEGFCRVEVKGWDLQPLRQLSETLRDEGWDVYAGSDYFYVS